MFPQWHQISMNLIVCTTSTNFVQLSQVHCKKIVSGCETDFYLPTITNHATFHKNWWCGSWDKRLCKSESIWVARWRKVSGKFVPIMLKYFTQIVKSTLLGLRHFFTTESPLTTTKNVSYFTLTTLSVLKIVKFLSWLFGHAEKQLD